LNQCQLCCRDTPAQYLEKHHLIPKSKNGKNVVYFCCDCGDQVHKFFTNKELQTRYNSIDSLKSDANVNKWIKWVSKKKIFGFCMRTKKKK
jgi:glutaredoxin-related protein